MVRNRMVKTSYRRLAGAAALLAGLAAGCQNGGTATSVKSAAMPVQHPMLAGIPLPADAVEQPERSVGRRSGQFRVGKYEFTTGNDRLTVLRFYKEMMPASGFQLRTEMTESGTYDLRFDNEAEECAVRIAPGNFGKTRLLIDIGPAPRTAAPPPAQAADREP